MRYGTEGQQRAIDHAATEAEACENCGGGDEIAGGLCSECFRSLPVGEWRAVGSWGLS